MYPTYICLLYLINTVSFFECEFFPNIFYFKSVHKLTPNISQSVLHLVMILELRILTL